MRDSTKGVTIRIALNMLTATSLFLALVLTATPAFAVPINGPANLRIECIGGTDCFSGTTTLITGDDTPEFNLYNTGQPVTGFGHLGVLVPNGSATIDVNLGSLVEFIGFTSGKLGDAANLDVPGLTDFEYAALVSASAQVGITAGSFVAYDWLLGPYNNGIDGISFEAPLPGGTVIVAWVENALGNALIRTPLSSSLTIPEPSTLLLLGAGLIGLGILGRRKFRS